MNLIDGNTTEEIEDNISSVTEKESVNSNDLSDLLSGYKSAPLETTDLNETDINEVNKVSSDTSDPLLYYQSGLKKGQLRPRAKKVTKESEPENLNISGDLISGALFLTLIDLIVPSVITALNNKFSKDKISVDDLSLTDKQKKELEKIADAVVKKINFNGSPLTLLIVSLLGIYGVNFAVLKSLNKKP